MFEWSNSPIVYRTTETWKQIYEVAKHYFSVKIAAYHYYGTAKSTYSQYLQEERVNYKKYFYALRPLLAGQSIQEHQCPPPVLFDTLMKMDMPVELRGGIEALLELKKMSEEREAGEPIPVIQKFIADEISRQKIYLEDFADDRKTEWGYLDECFLKVLG